MTYKEKLLDPRWQRKRLEILQRDEFKCTLCCDAKTTLHVHHEEYGINPWDTENSKLKSLCKHCHQLIEWASKSLDIKEVIKFRRNDGQRFLVAYAISREYKELQLYIIKYTDSTEEFETIIPFDAISLEFLYETMEKHKNNINGNL